jgi:hypothetical protein
VWHNIVALEAELDALCPRPAIAAVDLDFDGKTELFATADLQIVIRDDGLAAAHELSSYRLNHNFGDTLRRYHEHYHDKIGKEATEHQGEGIASAHDVIRFKHPVSPEDIVPDTLPRAIFLDELDATPLNDYVLALPPLKGTGYGFIDPRDRPLRGEEWNFSAPASAKITQFPGRPQQSPGS